MCGSYWNWGCGKQEMSTSNLPNTEDQRVPFTAIMVLLQLARAVEYNCIYAERWDSLPHKCPGYSTKLSDGETPILELWGMWTTPSLPLLPGPLWSGVAVPARVLSLDQIKLFNHLTVCKLMTDVKLNY